MPGIFEDERRGSGPPAPDPFGAGRIRPGVVVENGLWWAGATAPSSPSPGAEAAPAKAVT
jgi:hypothetical protein